MDVPPAGAPAGGGGDPVSRVVLAPGDGSLGPLLRIADDRLGPGQGYGRHDHRAVDVVAVVLAGELHHRWAAGADLAEGDIAVLRAGAGLAHDEVAGERGVRVLQCYLRSAAPDEPAAHAVHRSPGGWVDLARPDARLWVRRAAPGEELVPPAGLVLVADDDGVRPHDGGPVLATGRGTVLAWQLDAGRPSWAG